MLSSLLSFEALSNSFSNNKGCLKEAAFIVIYQSQELIHCDINTACKRIIRRPVNRI